MADEPGRDRATTRYSRAVSSIERPSLLTADIVPLVPPPDFAARLEAIGVTLPAPVLEQLGGYLARLLAVNEHMNLTSVRDPAEAWERHILDSLTLLPLLSKLGAGARLVDIGSGGGLPGIPLAIARPDVRVTLVESIQKKAGFLVAVSTALGLSNVSVRAERAEQLIASGGGSFDVVTARAVARLSALLPYTIRLAKPGGLVLFIKGQRAEEELKEARSSLGNHGAKHVKTVPTPTGRIVVLIRGR